MINWWDNLEPRERLLIMICGGFIALVILYFYLWEPFADNISTMRNQTQKDRELVRWMQPAITKIQQLKATGAIPRATTTQSLLVIANQSIQKAELLRFVTQIQQADTNKVTISFSQVPFDYLIKWLETIWKKDGVKIDQLAITPLATKGLVRAELTLER